MAGKQFDVVLSLSATSQLQKYAKSASVIQNRTSRKLKEIKQRFDEEAEVGPLADPLGTIRAALAELKAIQPPGASTWKLLPDPMLQTMLPKMEKLFGVVEQQVLSGAEATEAAERRAAELRAQLIKVSTDLAAERARAAAAEHKLTKMQEHVVWLSNQADARQEAAKRQSAGLVNEVAELKRQLQDRTSTAEAQQHALRTQLSNIYNELERKEQAWNVNVSKHQVVVDTDKGELQEMLQALQSVQTQLASKLLKLRFQERHHQTVEVDLSAFKSQLRGLEESLVTDIQMGRCDAGNNDGWSRLREHLYSQEDLYYSAAGATCPNAGDEERTAASVVSAASAACVSAGDGAIAGSGNPTEEQTEEEDDVVFIVDEAAAGREVFLNRFQRRRVQRYQHHMPQTVDCWR